MKSLKMNLVLLYDDFAIILVIRMLLYRLICWFLKLEFTSLTVLRFAS